MGPVVVVWDLSWGKLRVLLSSQEKLMLGLLGPTLKLCEINERCDIRWRKWTNLNTFPDNRPSRCVLSTCERIQIEALAWNGPIVKWKVEERLRQSPRRRYCGLVALLHFIAELLFIKRGFYLRDAAVSAVEGSQIVYESALWFVAHRRTLDVLPEVIKSVNICITLWCFAETVVSRRASLLISAWDRYRKHYINKSTP